ncbi:MAG TPA: 30S ribosomal protein S6 [Candidatus Saccharimonadales bacterium]|nr:30S ribosomal protein S6 [Candidatus Saccharimonadales bacterium]
MRIYELALVVKPTVKEAERKKVIEQVKEWLGKVKFSKEEDWGQKALAYPIKKQDSGHYYMMEIEAENVPVGFETRIIQNANILRHLLLRTK